MEYLIVTFELNDRRDVIANGDVIGQSDTTLMLAADYYEISLSGGNFTPALWTGLVSGTLATRPQRIVFTRQAGTASAGTAPTAPAGDA
jgi:hypothetical protein